MASGRIPERPFVLGVQWHPEYLPQMPRQRAIFRALVKAAGATSHQETTKATENRTSPPQPVSV